MEIVLALIYGAAVGALAHFTLAGRDTRGSVLGPMAGAVAGAGIWALLTWLGVTTASAWLWIAAIVAPTVVVYVLLPVVANLRKTHDARERARLGIA